MNRLKFSPSIFLFLLSLIISGFFQTAVEAQETKVLTLSLEDVLGMAKGNTPEVMLAKTQLSNSYWRLQSFKADFKPQLELTGQLPVLNRTISAIVLPDGTEAFIRRSLASSSAQVSLVQNIGLTGGQVFASTGLSRIDILSNDGNFTSYLSNPISIGLSQPILSFNAFKWSKLIRPLAYREAQRTYNEELEEKALQATTLFFDIFIAQINLEAATIDKANADTLFRISQGRFDVGKIAENELLQMELSANQEEVNLAQATLDLQNSTEDLRIFLGIKEQVEFDFLPPTEIPEYSIDPEKALEHALNSRKIVLEFKRRLLEADRDVAMARGENGFNANLFATFGLSGTSDKLAGSYANPLDEERLTFGIQVPIADWGKAKAERKIAESNRDLVQLTIEQERTNFEQDILLKVRQFELIRNRLKLAEKSFDIAQKRYDITRKRYLIGKIGVTELNIALNEQTGARQAYMQALRSFWYAHYEFRRLTLFDFQNNISLAPDED